MYFITTVVLVGSLQRFYPEKKQAYLLSDYITSLLTWWLIIWCGGVLGVPSDSTPPQLQTAEVPLIWELYPSNLFILLIPCLCVFVCVYVCEKSIKLIIRRDLLPYFSECLTDLPLPFCLVDSLSYIYRISKKCLQPFRILFI